MTGLVLASRAIYTPVAIHLSDFPSNRVNLAAH
jgi:hypothetical protein